MKRNEYPPEIIFRALLRCNKRLYFIKLEFEIIGCKSDVENAISIEQFNELVSDRKIKEYELPVFSINVFKYKRRLYVDKENLLEWITAEKRKLVLESKKDFQEISATKKKK